MKVLLLNAPWDGVRAGSRWPFKTGKRERYVERTYYLTFPFELCYTSSLLKKEGHEASVIDAIAEFLNPKTFVKKVIEEKPDIIVLETSTPSIYTDYKFAKLFLKKTNAKIVLAGPHVTVLYEEALNEIPNAIVARGEYEYTVLDLANEKNLRKIKGIAYKENEDIVVNKERELIKDLDSLPFPDRDSVPIYRYWDGFCQNYPSVQMITSRGCFFRCIFCVWNEVMDKHTWRPRSPENVADEIEEVITKYKFKEIYFDDSTFNMKPDHVYGICDEIMKRNIKIPWSAMCHAMTMDFDMLKRMKQAGCIGIKFGIESVDENVLRKIRKPMNLEKVKEIASLCKKLKIKSHATIMVGLPGESLETIKKTVKFIKELPVDSLQVSIATPFPGTEFFREANENGWLLTKDWSKYSGSTESVISYPHPFLSKKDIEKSFKCLCKVVTRKKIKSISFILNKLPTVMKDPSKGLKFLRSLF